MGIQTLSTAAPVLYLHYSSFLGLMYVSNPASEALISEAKIEAGGEAEVKKGYTGRAGATAKAVAFLRSKGLFAANVIGRLDSVTVRDVPIAGGSSPYINVALSDEEGQYVISAPLSSGGVQMLVRKLANAEMGIETEINLFAKYDVSPNPLYAGRSFANHGASLIQKGIQVPVVASTELVALVDRQVQALKDAGITDNSIVIPARNKATTQFHLDLLASLNAKAGVVPAPAVVAEVAPSVIPAPGVVFQTYDINEDLSNEIPF